MTPSLIRTQYLGMSFNENSTVQREGLSATIDLGSGLKISGNRREDFERLRLLSEKAIALFGDGESLK